MRVLATLPLVVSVVRASDVIHNGAWRDGANCIDHAWNADYGYIYQCHGESNQQWTLTEEGQIRSAQGNCLEYFDATDRIAIVPCDGYRRQKWYVSDGLVKPQGFRLSSGAWTMRVGFCLDAMQPDGQLNLHGCHGALNQKFSASFFPTEREDVVQIAGPWSAGENCLDYDYSSDVVYVYSCHGQWNQRWRLTKKDEVRVGADKCLEFDGSTRQVSVRTCNGASSQQWLVRDDKLIQAAVTSFSLCLHAPYPSTKLALATCDAATTTQQFTSAALKSKSRGLLKLAGPWKESLNCVDYAWGTDYAYVYSCHGEANQLWEFTSDQQIKTTDTKCLEFDGEALERVRVRTCNTDVMTQKWQVKASSGEILPRGFFTAGGVWRQPNKCLDATLEDGKLHLWDCLGTENQRFQSEVLPTASRDFVFASGASVAGSNCLRTLNGAALDGLVLVAKCAATRQMLWEFTKDGLLRVQLSDETSGTQCLTAEVTANKVVTRACTGSANQRWERTLSGGIALQSSAFARDKCLSWASQPAVSLVACDAALRSQKFSSSVLDGTASTSPQLASLFDAANTLSLAVKQDVFLTENVLSRASEVVARASQVLTSSGVSETQRATDFLVQFLTKSDNTTHPVLNASALYFTSHSDEFLLTLSILLQSDRANASAVVRAIEPALLSLSDQLYDARYEVLLDLVLRNDVNRLEAYSDGSLSDFDQVGGMLSAVCSLSTTAQTRQLAMCRLAKYFSLIDEFFVLKYQLLVDGPRGVSSSTFAQARTVATLFKDNQATFAQDKLWTRLMTLLLLGSAFVDVVPPAQLARASASDEYLLTFVLYAALGTNPAFLQQVDPVVRFLSDQITTFHVANLLVIVTNQDVDALDAYMAEPFGGFRAAPSANMSDFPTMAKYVAPLVCSDAPRVEPLSVCRLQEFHEGLQSVVRFEKARRSSDVSLADLLEVDVRKRLDVLDAEKKHFEMLSSLQDVANRIGTTLSNGFRSLSQQLSACTAAIRADIEKSRQDIRTAIGDVGRQLQDSIDASTELLYVEVGQQAAAIRGDIAESSRQLRERLDDTGRAILAQIEQSKQELKTQIGAEAAATRERIDMKTQELKSHMTHETQGLREFIDLKTIQVIGVVRDESQLTRQTVNDAAGQIIKTVEKEGAMTRAFVDTKTSEIKEVVRAESEKTREFVDVKTNQVIKVVKEEAQTTRSYIDEKGNQIIGVVKDEGEKTRKEVRAEGEKIRTHIDQKTEEIVGVVRDEGAKTREHVNQQTAELKQHISSESGSVQRSIAEAQTTILGKSEQQFQAISGAIGGVRSDIAASTTQVTGTVREAMGVLGGVSVQECGEYNKSNADFVQIKKTYQSALTELRQAAANIRGSLRMKEDQGSPEPFASAVVRSIVSTFVGEFDALDIDELLTWWGVSSRYPSAGDSATDKLHGLLNLRRALALKRSLNPSVWTLYLSLLNTVDTTLTDFSVDYAGYNFDLVEDDMLSLFNWVRRWIEDECMYDERCEPTAVACVPNFARCKQHYGVVEQVQGLLQNTFNARAQVKEAMLRVVATGVRCSKGANAVNWSKLSGRRLQASTRADEPYFAMTYTALTKILLEYRLQEAAFRFCKYYEFKNGGVAPPMCGTSSATTLYYTLAQIQAMRSWQPVPQRRLTKRLLLPTQSAVQPQTNHTYPFVDVATLQSGGSVLFAPPIWDLEWLKKHGWVLSNTKEETFPSYYVESIRLYLPVQTNDTTGAASTAAFTITAKMEAMPAQFPSWKQRDRMYRLPVQAFTFDATYGEPFCVDTSTKTNPYHAAAECVVSTGRVSEVCALSDGSTGAAGDTAQRMLLPSLFATWRISADYDRDDKLFALVAPFTPRSSDETAVPLNLVADVTLVQATATTSSLRSETEVAAVAGPTTCCAGDAYKTLQGVCVTCPVGSKAALNGYTCSA